jgi:hypothetical protein
MIAAHGIGKAAKTKLYFLELISARWRTDAVKVKNRTSLKVWTISSF